MGRYDDYTVTFRLKVGDIICNEKINITILKQIYYQNDSNKKCVKKYKYRCNICGYKDGVRSEYSILSPTARCPCCVSQIIVYGINDITTTAPWMVKFFQGGHNEAKAYSKNSNKRVYLKCPDCGVVKKTKTTISNLYKRNSIGCECGDNISYPERLMIQILKQQNIKFIREYSPLWLYPKRYDFFLSEIDIIIEMDGYLHATESVIICDNFKDRLATENNISVIRIDCKNSTFSNIKTNILNSVLVDYIDTDIINWSECNELAQNNIVKDVCEYYNTVTQNTLDISMEFNIGRTTVVRYLKRGSAFEWCGYNPQEATTKRALEHGKSKSKGVLVYKDDIFVGEYPSMSELKRRSKSDFGVEFSLACISYVCNKRFSQHKGYNIVYK